MIEHIFYHFKRKGGIFELFPHEFFVHCHHWCIR
jgi:hypothetical protein